MRNHEQYRQSIESSRHVRTLAAMMAQDGIDIVHAVGELEAGTPFVVIVVQGHFVPSAEFAARVMNHQMAEIREAQKRDATGA